MRLSSSFVAALATAAIFSAVTTAPAQAECKRYGFSVNDYGKDGPTKDAKSLLDKLIATKMSEKGIKDYKTGKKSVRCEMFLNFIVFDEYTCTAEATACWGGSSLPKSDQASADDNDEDETKAAAAKPSKDEKKEAAVNKNEEPAVKMSDAADKAVKATKSTEKTETASTKKAEAASKEEASSTAASASKAEAAKDRIAKEVADKAIPDPKDARSASDTAKAEDPATEAVETKEAKHEDTAPAGASSAATTDTANASSSTSDKAATASSDKSGTSSATAAAAQPKKKQEAAAKKASETNPVETGSLAEPAKKAAAKHSAEKSAKSTSRSVRHLAPEAGYPVPMPPPADLSP
jgi:hypothetical protein